MRIILYRYLVKEQLVPLSVCFLGLTFVLVTGRLLQLARYLFTSSLTVLDLMELMTFAMPRLILYALPMATLVGVLLAFVRLNSDNELISLRSAGISFAQVFPSVVSVLLLATLFSFYNTIYLLPSANASFEEKLKAMSGNCLSILLKEGAFITNVPKLVFFFQKVNGPDLSMEGVYIQDQRQPGVHLTIVAERAHLLLQQGINHPVFRMRDGVITRVAEDYKDAQSISFKSYDLALSLDEMLGTTARGGKGRKEMSLAELRHVMRGVGRSSDVHYSLEFHQRLALPMSCFILGLVGAPLGALFRQRSRMTGITFGLGIFLAYYIALSAGKGLGENRILPPVLASWGPNLMAVGLSLYFWVKIQRETPFILVSVWKLVEPYLLSAAGFLSRFWKSSKHTT